MEGRNTTKEIKTWPCVVQTDEIELVFVLNSGHIDVTRRSQLFLHQTETSCHQKKKRDKRSEMVNTRRYK